MADRQSDLQPQEQEARISGPQAIRAVRRATSMPAPSAHRHFIPLAAMSDRQSADGGELPIRRTPETIAPALRPRIGEFRPGLDYVLGETLRRDPLGVTYRARDVSGGRDIAVTLYPSAATPNARAIERFQDAVLVAAVEHPAILPAERAGRWRAQVAVARRLVYAPTLAEALPRGMRCELPRALEILRPVASALDMAHGLGVVHGDVRPEAILLTKSSGPLLVGCGVAEGLDLGAVLVATLERRSEWGWSWLEAAAPYLAPERWRAGVSDARGDQYALAIMTFRMLTGELPFAAEHVARLAEIHRIAVIPRASILRPELPPSVDVAITRALAKVAAERFTTLTQFVDALSGQLPRVRPVATNPAHATPAGPAANQSGRGAVLIVAVVGAMLLAVSAAAALLLH